MKILRVDVGRGTAVFEDLPEAWRLIGGSGLLAKIMNAEVPPLAAPLGPENKLIIAAGPLAGTRAPQSGRVSIGGKSPLTLGIKEANSGGPAAQKMDRLGIRAVIVEGVPEAGRLYTLVISKDGARLDPADDLRGLKTYRLVEVLAGKHAGKPAVICIGPAGERLSRAASVSLTDMYGDPSRNAGRGGLGAVMGSKGLKAVVIDDAGAPGMEMADDRLYKDTVKDWIDTLRHDINCGLFSKFGTPHAVAQLTNQGTMPGDGYHSGSPGGYISVTGESIQKIVFERGGWMHGCMPGCVVQCSISYPDAEGRPMVSAYEYEAIAMLGTNLGLADPDAIGRLKRACDELGLDLIEIGSALSVAAEAGRMALGDEGAAMRMMAEIENDTELGRALADGVVRTARVLDVKRVPAVKGQAIPGHDPRGVKGVGVTYATSPMGADHTAGLAYRSPLSSKGQAGNSLRFQIQAAICDTFGYCINAVPGRQASLSGFLATLLRARFGGDISSDDVVEMAKQTIRDQLAFNRQAEFGREQVGLPEFIRTEALPGTQSVFDVEADEIENIWQGLDAYREPEKVWEVRMPVLPPILFGIGVLKKLGERVRKLKIEKVLLIADPIMESLGRAGQVRDLLEKAGIEVVVFSEVEPDPPIELLEKAGQVYRENHCRGLVALGGGSSMDTAKGVAVRVSQPGAMTEYESLIGGTAKIKPPLPPIICIPTTSGTGSEVNQHAAITDKQRDIKFVLMSEHLTPRLAVIDPEVCRTMPPQLTAESGIDALGHCVEAYVGVDFPYHPYYESLALYGVKMVGRSLRKAYRNGDDLDARSDMCQAAVHGGISFRKGLGIGHALAHVLGAHYHMSHGKAVAFGLLCFIRGNQSVCREAFADLAWALDRSDDLEKAVLALLGDLNIPTSLKHYGIPREDLKKIAFFTNKDVVNMATNPAVIGERGLMELLESVYD
ncbi:MAG: iron-containing alcohol dehydrogenase [Proteobacteria bacterium]|nr:iron-containing alcohol dehydrogenase [Pseudomonadota bacterium]